MDILKQKLAPITNKAWYFVENQAKEFFNTQLSARKVVQVSEPRGWDYAAVPTGRLEFPGSNGNQFNFGLRQVLPLVELRFPFKLDIWSLDNISRGAKFVDLDSMQNAARELARFEDNTIFNGLNVATIQGMKESSSHDKIKYPSKLESMPQTIAHGINLLRSAAVQGPYALILGSKKWEQLTTHVEGYPLIMRIEEILEGPIINTQNSDDAFLVPEQDNNLLLTLGNDISIGYESHDSKQVELFFTESFMFQVLDGAEIIYMS